MIKIRIVSKNFFIAILGVALKARKTLKISFLIFTLSSFTSCKSDDVQLPDKRLEGNINGEAWNYKSANGYLFSSDFQYRVRFLSDKETVTDPCSLPSPSLTHVSAIFRPIVGSFFIAPQAIDNNQAQVVFEISPSERLIAVSGFMEIFAIENQVVIGYLQAALDDDNTVVGSFEIRLCN